MEVEDYEGGETDCALPSNISIIPAMKPTARPIPPRTSRKTLMLDTKLAASPISAATSAASAASPAPFHSIRNISVTSAVQVTILGVPKWSHHRGPQRPPQLQQRSRRRLHGTAKGKYREEQRKKIGERLDTCCSSLLAPLSRGEKVGKVLHVHHARCPARNGDGLLP